MALLRRFLRAAREHPGVTIAAVVVLLGSTIASAAIVVATGDSDENTTLPPVTTSTTVPSTTTAPSTTVASTTTVPPTTAAPTTTVASTTTVAAGQRCLVRLHGKGGGGADTYTAGGVKVLTPGGNADAEGWGGRQWLYFPNGRYNETRKIVADAIDDENCDHVIINGFSNGAAFAAKLYCRGETFDERVVGVVVDDPVVDSAVEGCDPASGVDITLYWTGALESTAQPGWDCEDDDWTCEGGATIGIDAYENAIGAAAKQSKYTDHQWFQDAPELSAW